MSVTCKHIMQAMECLAPQNLAEEWDSVGLMVGNPDRQVRNVWTTLDVTLELVEAAVEAKVDMIVSHHPLIFKAIKRLDTSTVSGKIMEKLMQGNIAVFSAHTNLDCAVGGVNDILAQMLHLQDIQLLTVNRSEKLVKFVVFVPKDYEQVVFAAITKAGAGHIGRYSHCTFASSGTGTFLPLEDTHPFIGRQGSLARVDEMRMETILPERLIIPVLEAMHAVHPYEEVAYDLYPLYNQLQTTGLGRIGTIQPVSLRNFSQQVKQLLHTDVVSMVGRSDQMIHTVAVCGGSGADLIKQAKKNGADVFVTGDVKYHDALDAAALDLAIIDAGHYPTEQPVVARLSQYLSEKFPLLEVKSNISQKNIFQLC
ncbi:dinuclear metal center YbgI/SA1388 family protein [Sporomusaceae bacterium BoRhaA]|uniref:Nif3-like dinuclear metal center hexameric protein n=1 Tax=Pelorhabdus rhamnosifermentans TaxID=2772457 RepID=UPI001C0617A1|nr:Nif3-like dinuclear metal center hexameric protein [Pelorhabdus rhamnosifermentans]MBU2701521.1 dinuclear metal center YbgI/SA1388 family protein [Pelorhabdus rhamnosifermentans]